MIIHRYAACWNEGQILGFFFRHYDGLVNKFFIFDDGSNDGSIELLRGHQKVELRKLERSHPDSIVASLLDLYNDCWKESRGEVDWAFITNVDEHLYHPHLVKYLETCKRHNVTLVPALGYQMIARDFPAPDQLLCQAATLGAPWENMSKLSVFNPNAIEEVNFAVGRHSAAPSGVVRLPPRDELMNLHYKYLGLTYMRRRQSELRARLLEHDLEMQWGAEYFWDDPKLEADWRAHVSRCVDVSDSRLQPWLTHGTSPWWRTHVTESL